MKKLHSLFLIFLFSFIFSISSYADTMNKQEVAAQMIYLAAIDGEEENIEQAEKVYQALLKTGKNLLSYKLHLASLEAMWAREIFWPHLKLKHVNASIRQFDKLKRRIYKRQDKDLIYEFHLYRGLTFIHFPSFLNKRDIALSDMRKAIDLFPSLQRYPQEVGILLLSYAQALDDDDLEKEAKIYAKQALSYELNKTRQEAVHKLLRD